MNFFVLLFLLHFSVSYCDRHIDFNGTSFYFTFLMFTAQTVCINSTKDDWSFLINEGIQNFNVTVYYKDQEGMSKVSQTSSDFLGAHIFGSNSSIEIKIHGRSILSFALVSFDNDCDIRIISNLMRDNITAKDWSNSELTDKKLCYFNGLCYKNHFTKIATSRADASFYNSDGSNFSWLSNEFDTTTLHPPMLELSYDKNTHISVYSEDFSIMNHGRSVLILNSTNKKTTLFTGVPYDPSVCLFYDFTNEIEQISYAKVLLSLLSGTSAVICIVYTVTYCFCCSCCRYYRPQCLYRFGLKPSDESENQNYPNTNANEDFNSHPPVQQPIYYVYRQHISQTPEIAQQGPNSDGQFQQPLLSMTTNPPPGIYEPVRVAAPIVPVTIVNDESI